MPFDPLYFETTGLPALLRELGVPDGVAVHILRPDRAWQAAHARRLEGYQLMALISGAPDAEGKWPPTWAPGSAPYVWLARIRFQEDLVYGEVRPSAEQPSS